MIELRNGKNKNYNVGNLSGAFTWVSLWTFSFLQNVTGPSSSSLLSSSETPSCFNVFKTWTCEQSADQEAEITLN